MIKFIESVNEYDELINEGTVLVDFYAPWCGPCNMLTPVLEKIDDEGGFGEIKVIKVNVDDFMDIAARYGIQSIPTLFLIKNGEIKNKALGYMNENQILNFIAK